MTKVLNSLLVVLVLWAIPQTVWAVEPLDWKTHGLGALVIATIGAIILAKRNPRIESVHGHIFGFGIYFWVIMFTEAILYSIYYVTLR
ncbi:hypothetical protein [Pleionea sp. CnH1-48]|uniref:hypothetical protein n=1 Tax=Pleionea sp. CnH1-48 TaxID=2954494 RepID=UPI002096F418|nr:hypothetical protein [Pleionea sp. CnH1-48]MCO7225621.1 hypothetical protein [Pleionea sp. CnH1-48]